MTIRALAAAALLAVACSPPVAAQGDGSWQKPAQESSDLFSEGKYARSLAVAQKGLESVERSQGPHHPVAAIFLTRMAECYRMQARFGEAEPLYERAMKILDKGSANEHP